MQPVKPQTEKLTLSRDVLTPGNPDRDQLTTWTVDFPLFSHQFPVGKLVRDDGSEVSLTAKRSRPWTWSEPFYIELRLMEAAKPGPYKLLVDGYDAGQVNVRPFAEPSAIVETNNLAKALALLPTSDVRLDAGVYMLSDPISLPQGRRLLGVPGATHIVMPPQPRYYNGTEGIFASIGDSAEIRGIDFTFPNIFYPWPANDVLVADCHFQSNSWRIDGQGGNSGGGWFYLNGKNNLVTGCKFSRGGRGGGDGIAFIGCEFQGQPDCNCHAFQSDGNNASLMMYDCLFNGTDRGPVIRPMARDVTEVFVSHIRIENVNQMYNGGEAICFEGPLCYKAHRSIFNNFRVSNSVCNLMLGNPTHNNRFHGIVGKDVYVVFQDGMSHTDNVIVASEFRNGRMYLGDGARNNLIKWTGFIGWDLTAHNQMWSLPTNDTNSAYRQYEKYKAAITQMVPGGNTIDGCTFRMPSGIEEVLNPTVRPPV